MTEETRGWCRNLIEAGRLEPGEDVLVIVDEPLTVQGSQFADAVKQAGGRPRLELWAGQSRPLAHPPPGVVEGAKEATFCVFLSQDPIGAEANARFEVMERLADHGGR
ncbi:MAG: hypothetical protein ACREV8_02995, partial [Gammaproteobacteria bacterium]